MLSPEELARLASAESLFPSPIPVQSVSSDEFMPAPQSSKQAEFEARVKESGARMAKRLGISRRRFFQSAAGMAAAFLAMNDTYGPLYGVSRAEAAEPERASQFPRPHSPRRAKKPTSTQSTPTWPNWLTACLPRAPKNCPKPSL